MIKSIIPRGGSSVKLFAINNVIWGQRGGSFPVKTTAYGNDEQG